MNDFAGMEELMQDFLTEASDLLSDVDSKLMGLEKSPHDRDLLNVIFRGFHTIKGAHRSFRQWQTISQGYRSHSAQSSRHP